MSLRRLCAHQPGDAFCFNEENLAWAQQQLAKYPDGRQQSAVIPLLWRAQKQNNGWVSRPVLEYIADFLSMAYIRVYEVATFYTMFNLQPAGQYFVQVCTTTPCMLCGSDDIVKLCREHIGEPGQVSADGLWSWQEVECLGACANGPMVQISENHDKGADPYYEDLDSASFDKLLSSLKAGEPLPPGSMKGRKSSEPAMG